MASNEAFLKFQVTLEQLCDRIECLETRLGQLESTNQNLAPNQDANAIKNANEIVNFDSSASGWNIETGVVYHKNGKSKDLAKVFGTKKARAMTAPSGMIQRNGFHNQV